MKHDDLSRTMKIKSNLSRSLRDEQIKCLRSYVDMFAWSHEDEIQVCNPRGG